MGILLIFFSCYPSHQQYAKAAVFKWSFTPDKKVWFWILMLSTLESDSITVWIAHPVPTCCSSASEIWPGYHLHPGNKIPMHIPNCTAASIQPPHSLQSHWKSSDTLLGKGRQLHCFDPSFSHRCQVLQGRRCVLDHSLLPALALALLWLIGELK